MDRKRLLVPCGLVISTSYLSFTYHTSFAFDRPLHTIGIVFLLSSIAILAYTHLTRGQRFTPRSKGRYDAIPLSDGAGSERDETPVVYELGSPLSRSFPLRPFIALVFSICARVAVHYSVFKGVECSGPTILEWLPFVLAVFHAGQNWVEFARLRPSLDGVIGFLFRGHSRFLLPMFLLSLSSFLAAFRAYSLRSTFVCPQANGEAVTIPRLQTLGFLIDCVAAFLLHSLIEDETEEKGTRKSNVLVGLALLASATVIGIGGTYAYIAFPEHRQWILSAPGEYVRAILSLSIVVPGAVVCFLFTARLYGVMNAFSIVAFASAYTMIWRLLRTEVWYTFPPKPTSELVVYWMLLTLALIVAFVTKTEVPNRPRFLPRLGKVHAIVSAVVCLILFYGFFGMSRTSAAPEHPITILIQAAHAAHDSWVQQAASSKTLAHAVTRYKERYSRDPPPGFDKWYQYATDRNSLVIDDFDNIEDDLKPFWSLSPTELRERTAFLLADEHSALGGISIRNGKVESMPGVPGTHQWMVDGTIEMIKKFAEFIPDMDLVVNLDDECRVAVPYDRLQAALEHKEHFAEFPEDERKTIDFSGDRASTWIKTTEISVPESLFVNTKTIPSFLSFGTIACPSWSHARRERHWNTRYLCTHCAAPHSVGTLVSNWTLSADPCHQPDLANLHGLHLAPSAFTGTHALVPIFSQSKAHGYADIRYPSPWNYMDKQAYKFTDEYPDPPFVVKEKKLFWRGTATEGSSAGWGAWKGMLRQRLVHLVNHFDGPQAVLIKDEKTGEYRYVREEVGTIKYFLSTKTDIQFVDKVEKCGGVDCIDQIKEFKFADRVEFLQHWRYRYLFDSDGAGFSGRFLPFLQSNSVVFKAAVFREWYEGRLKAWKHFVPVDVRLHDLWSSLVYFGGYKGAGKIEGNEKEAQRIARESRVWSSNVLRKEDMEIYFFRLLLEWGRLTDEKRGEVGFRLKEGLKL
ncbi:hypothetical protein GQ43DRAFT_389196 [Delitschia confertaspora ATCC 74209]|uniref:Glycosyl transferase CAP10 domain-containing protein n=1 Tax=Delitschia confertaspora ATCC 74209 TaxID=1513339 RepID=A0A9P4JSY0_9PLEO|nr:hypothetical protein GQ43DRAFT_389196 [Delitschia confertaspora ATCC 74209]